jgi:hypothetical protein
MDRYYIFKSDSDFRKVYALSALMGGSCVNESKIALASSSADLAIRINDFQRIEVVERVCVPEVDPEPGQIVQYYPGLEADIADEYIFSALRAHTVQDIFPAPKVPYAYDDPYPAASQYLLYRAFAAGIKDKSYGTHSGEVFSFAGETDFVVPEAGKRYHVAGTGCIGDAWAALNGHLEFTEAEEGVSAIAHFV